jgi:hypothetical protein
MHQDIPYGGLQRGELVADDGEVLADVLIELSEAQELEINQVLSGKGKLLQYYFVHGQRPVRLAVGGALLPGSLRTAWAESSRRWSVALSA